MARTVHLIHGFNEHHKKQRPKMIVLEPLIAALGLNVMIHDYGHWDLVATRNNDNLARLIFPHINEGDTLVGFSNGAAIIAHLERLGVRAKRIVLIQPALAKTWTPNKFTRSIAVFWNEGDRATIAGKWWRRLTGFLPWRWQDRHNWGEMGNTGYRGYDERYVQYQTDAVGDDAHQQVKHQRHQQVPPKVSGHSTWTKPKSSPWWEIIVSHV